MIAGNEGPGLAGARSTAGRQNGLEVEQRYLEARDGTRIGSTIPMLLRVLRARSALANRATRAIVGSRAFAFVLAMTRVGIPGWQRPSRRRAS